MRFEISEISIIFILALKVSKCKDINLKPPNIHVLCEMRCNFFECFGDAAYDDVVAFLMARFTFSYATFGGWEC